MNMKTNSLYYGDCLEVMKPWPDKSVDLIYLDPPFNSKVKYNVLFGAGKHEEKYDLAQMTAFSDVWEWDIDAEQRVANIERAIAHPAHPAISAFRMLYPQGSGLLSYLSYMAERIAEMRRLLKPSGSLFLHCDPTAGHYLKLLMDSVFGGASFRNEIIWCYTGPGSPNMRQFNRKHDSIFWYSAGKTWTFNADDVRVPYTDEKQTLRKRMGEKFDDAEEIKKYRERGKIPETWWQMRIAPRSKKEYLGYPTQKPLALLQRIIAAASNPGDIVLDPFCGCGTTIDASHRLRRDWIGIDISSYAIEVIRRERMKDLEIPLEGMPRDLEAARHLAQGKPFEFEKWAITRIPGFAPNTVQRGDSGIDGRALIYGLPKADALCIAQVKGGKPGIDALRAFAGVIDANSAAVGVFITLNEWDTPEVKKCIAGAGTLKVGAASYNRLVMYSIERHLRGDSAPLPPLAHPRTGLPFQAELRASG
ncbi:MAG: site-specific DNA-methyltransferase [Gammaproteobacteria bacterium]|nr:site-specific DNA-methyltransferase [Gammaproteobacteria bacterium]